MSEEFKPEVGTIAWRDLTVENADEIRDFYGAVCGWTFVRHPMANGEYDDYCMQTADGKTVVSGICHARGVNAKLPPQWLVYVAVKDLDNSIRQCEQLGGKVIDGPRNVGDKPFCVIQDPAGACAALIQV